MQGISVCKARHGSEERHNFTVIKTADRSATSQSALADQVDISLPTAVKRRVKTSDQLQTQCCRNRLLTRISYLLCVPYKAPCLQQPPRAMHGGIQKQSVAVGAFMKLCWPKVQCSIEQWSPFNTFDLISICKIAVRTFRRFVRRDVFKVSAIAAIRRGGQSEFG